ncbi:MAG: AmmeMemoRadiSam system protein B [Myxococcales bacterium]|nr:AmmeMemoRadiSam system protein B [Myxococcales bacterium]
MGTYTSMDANDRHPVVAGRFYPGEASELMAQVRYLLGETLGEERALAAIAPHAGYVYSGSVAGQVYGRLRVPGTVVVLGPNHTGAGARASILSRGNFRVPGAAIPIDAAFAEELRALALLTDDARAHAQEHSLEVHLPFLLARNPKVRIVPLCLSAMPYSTCARIGTALADVINNRGGDVLIVASTDMSHYLPVEEARRLDGLALDRVLALDPEGLYATVQEHGISMCGVIPTTIALVAARALGAAEAELVRYAHSGEVSGDLERVVGYAGLLIR